MPTMRARIWRRFCSVSTVGLLAVNRAFQEAPPIRCTRFVPKIGSPGFFVKYLVPLAIVMPAKAGIQ
jgi:hypothetical protein